MAKTFTVSVAPLKNVEDVLESLGGFGRFQFLILVLLLSLEIPASFVVFSPVFIGASPKVWTCDNSTISRLDVCLCNGTLSSNTPSIVSEFGLVCELSWVSDFITTIQMLGMMVGNFVTGIIADWYGRKWTFLGTTAFMSSGTILSAFAPNVYLFGVARFICGVGFSGFVCLSGTYAMEFMTPRWRIICSSVGPFGEGIMLLGVLAYYFQDSWRHLLLATAVPFSFIVIIFPFLPESPRYLLRNQKITEAHEVFNYMARINRTPCVDLGTLQKIADLEKNEGDSATDKVKKISILELFKDKEVRLTTICLCVIWSMWAICYFGISYNIKNVAGNPYLNVIFLGLCDALGYPCSFVMNSIFTRRKSLAIFMTGASVFLVSLAIVQLVYEVTDKPTLVLCLLFFGKFSAAGGRASARTLTGESFPTSIRNMGFGVVGTTAALIGLLAPQIAYLGSRWPPIPLFIFAACSLLGASASFLLKETKGEPLQEGVKKPRRVSIISIVNSVRRFSIGAVTRK